MKPHALASDARCDRQPRGTAGLKLCTATASPGRSRCRGRSAASLPRRSQTAPARGCTPGPSCGLRRSATGSVAPEHTPPRHPCSVLRTLSIFPQERLIRRPANGRGYFPSRIKKVQQRPGRYTRSKPTIARGWMRRHRAKVPVTIAGWAEHAALMGALSTPPIKWREPTLSVAA